jgi:hypothetical protein
MGRESALLVNEWLTNPNAGRPVPVSLELPNIGPKVDGNGRLLAFIRHGGQSLTSEFLRRGLAGAYLAEYAFRDGVGSPFQNIDEARRSEFTALENAARIQFAGFWGAYRPQAVNAWQGLTRVWPNRCESATYRVAGPGSASERFMVDNFVRIFLNGHLIGEFGNTPGDMVGPATFQARSGDILRIDAYDDGGGRVLGPLWLYRASERVLKLTDGVPRSNARCCGAPVLFFSRAYSVP